MKVNTHRTCYHLRLNQSIEGISFPINKRKMILGSDPKCDIVLNDSLVSSYHAFILLQEDGIHVKDLSSETKIFVNGQMVLDIFISPGDTLTFGNSGLIFEEINDLQILEDKDATISQSAELRHIMTSEGESAVLVDGELCHLKFDDTESTKWNHSELLNVDLEINALDSLDNPKDLLTTINSKKIEVLHSINGVVLDVKYLDLLETDYFLEESSAKKNHLPFSSLGKVILFSYRDKKFAFNSIADAQFSSDPVSTLEQGETLYFTYRAEQLSLRMVNQSFNFLPLPWLFRERESIKYLSKNLAFLLLPFLILMSVFKGKEPQKKEEVAVIYELPKTLPQKVEVAAASMNSASSQSTPSKSTKNNSQQVAKPTSTAAPINGIKAKAYEFTSDLSIAEADITTDLNNRGSSKSKPATSENSFNHSSSNKSSLVDGSGAVSKFNEGAKAGSGSFGSRGLANKTGFDTSSVSSKTMVLGSMDPELLRRILSEYIPQFRHCYQQELVDNSDKLRGIIDLNFTIGPEGKVAKFDIRSKDAGFSHKGIGCMRQVLTLIDFPRPKGGGVVDVKQPLNFFAESEKI
jgi:pSer/pThr/pTyr-binding forkhead associated (FHA) protein